MFKAKATRDERIAALSGHVFHVLKDRVYEFPDVVRTEVILGGCVPVDDATPVEVEPENPAVDRPAKIYEAVVDLMARNDARVLTRDGYPNIQAVSKLTGFKPTIAEIVAAYSRLNSED